ncbi:MAG: S-methyl-5-thioribose-1-phosphate isomerase [Nanoarchaeota archaeon]|nr:S-methyl-5-thioribose-1-phosphate isomerase [Nanoarchaeota archaeon]MBU4300167.1 S-methyl-5-thioribose-1-phosphate isomerase [Nanoarchaeota archaeon]MBU4452203.1 S-methyl-5-thioribose-1-phosphate isomerase [Nanoarchaeota archaeon]MCG2724373.1 S-methyl-5-thioribose-1-phosphate isomerase [archaeon]
MQVQGKHYRTVWMEGNSVKMINQLLLPHKFEIASLATHKDTARAIKDMTVRGAGAIGVSAGFAMAQAFIESNDAKYLEEAKKHIESTRPTAQNLFYATNRVLNAAKNSKEAAILEAQKIADEDAENCRKIGELGSALIKDGAKIETHCNAGWLAFSDWGSALSPIYFAKRQGKKVFVYVDETRPRLQGMLLTSWELENEGIEHKIIPDNAGAFYMSQGIDIMLVGADRIAANGDTANKIGTFEKAIMAKEFGVPFYIAAPTTTIDLKCASGKDIPIEERSEDEVLYVSGIDDGGSVRKVRIAPQNSRALNPAFDVTPAKYITGIITEKGIVKPNNDEIKQLFEH